MFNYRYTGHEVFGKLVKLAWQHVFGELVDVDAKLCASETLVSRPERRENLLSCNKDIIMWKNNECKNSYTSSLHSL